MGALADTLRATIQPVLDTIVNGVNDAEHTVTDEAWEAYVELAKFASGYGTHSKYFYQVDSGGTVIPDLGSGYSISVSCGPIRVLHPYFYSRRYATISAIDIIDVISDAERDVADGYEWADFVSISKENIGRYSIEVTTTSTGEKMLVDEIELTPEQRLWVIKEAKYLLANVLFDSAVVDW